MEFYSEMFLSVWHLLVLLLTLMAFLAMVLGGYSKKQIFKTTVQSFFVFYIVVSVFITYATYDEEMMKRDMYEQLDEIYEENRDGGNDIIVHVGELIDDNDSSTIKVYVGNFHDTDTFKGTIKVRVFDEEGEKEIKTYEKVVLDPGEKAKIGSYYSPKSIDKYEYSYEEE